MLHLQEIIALYYVLRNIRIVKHVIEIIHVFHALMKHFMEDFVMNHVVIVLEVVI